MKIPKITAIHHPDMKNAIAQLPTKGKLTLSKNKLYYLKVDDEYIHSTFSLIKNSQLIKPNYFGKDGAGAHISVVYPEEKTILKAEELNRLHEFTVQNIVAAELADRVYYVLLINSPSLLGLRKHYGLTEKLPFKGYAIDFHITFGKIIL